MFSILDRLAREESGQDLIEYALLSALIGVVTALIWTNMRAAMGNAYGGWDTGVQSLSACTPDPGGGGC